MLALYSITPGTWYRGHCTNAVPTINVWHHVVVTAGNGVFSFYYDGALIESSTYSGAISSTGNSHQIGYYNVHASRLKTPASFAIDELSVYNRSLTSHEVASLYSDTPITYVRIQQTTSNAITLADVALYYNNAKVPISG